MPGSECGTEFLRPLNPHKKTGARGIQRECLAGIHRETTARCRSTLGGRWTNHRRRSQGEIPKEKAEEGRGWGGSQETWSGPRCQGSAIGPARCTVYVTWLLYASLVQQQLVDWTDYWHVSQEEVVWEVAGHTVVAWARRLQHAGGGGKNVWSL